MIERVVDTEERSEPRAPHLSLPSQPRVRYSPWRRACAQRVAHQIARRITLLYFGPYAPERGGLGSRNEMQPVLWNPRQRPPVQDVNYSARVGGEAVVTIAVIRVRPGHVEAHARHHRQVSAELDAPVARVTGVAIVEPRCGNLIRNELAPHICLKNGDGVCQPAVERAPRAQLVVHGVLRLETRIESARPRRRIGELGGCRRLE